MRFHDPYSTGRVVAEAEKRVSVQVEDGARPHFFSPVGGVAVVSYIQSKASYEDGTKTDCVERVYGRRVYNSCLSVLLPFYRTRLRRACSKVGRVASRVAAEERAEYESPEIDIESVATQDFR